MKTTQHTKGNEMTTATLEIKRIVNVVDTRQWEEGPDDRFHPIPNSGTVNQCDRCGRDHEIHATVELTDGTTATVGTGCMKQSAFDKALRSSATQAKNVARLTIELELAEKYTADRKAATEWAMSLDAPPVERRQDARISGWWALHCGQAELYAPTRERCEERCEEVVIEWRRRQVESCCPIKHVSPIDLRRKLDTAKAKLAKLAQ
jgi:hypothetical protein